MKIALIYFLTVNAVSIGSMLADKLRARKNLWRIPEARLIWLAVLGGSPGILLGMQLFRHKTLHPKFSIGVPVIFAVQVVCLALAFPYLI